jgi:repressor LexA
MKGLTQRQRHVLEIIVRKIKEQGFPPTLQDLTEALGVSSRNTAVKHLTALARKKYIVWEKNKARGIRLLEPMGLLDGENEKSLPLVGAVTAGLPMLAEENIERYVPVPRYLCRSTQTHYLLRVQGDSMKNAGILDNDLVVVRSQSSAGVGDVIVALLDNEATVKRLASRGGERYLKAENPDYTDIHPTGEWTIQGKVVALVRENVE